MANFILFLEVQGCLKTVFCYAEFTLRKQTFPFGQNKVYSCCLSQICSQKAQAVAEHPVLIIHWIGFHMEHEQLVVQISVYMIITVSGFPIVCPQPASHSVLYQRPGRYNQITVYSGFSKPRLCRGETRLSCLQELNIQKT